MTEATSGDVRDQPKVADAASELLEDFGKDKSPNSKTETNKATKQAKQDMDDSKSS